MANIIDGCLRQKIKWEKTGGWHAPWKLLKFLRKWENSSEKVALFVPLQHNELTIIKPSKEKSFSGITFMRIALFTFIGRWLLDRKIKVWTACTQQFIHSISYFINMKKVLKLISRAFWAKNKQFGALNSISRLKSSAIHYLMIKSP